MKAEPATHAAHGHAAHRPQGNRGAAADPRGGDPFAQLLADLRAEDDPGLPVTDDEPAAGLAGQVPSSGDPCAEMGPDASRAPLGPEDETDDTPHPSAGIDALLGHPLAPASPPSQAEGIGTGAITPTDGDAPGVRSAMPLPGQAPPLPADATAMTAAPAHQTPATNLDGPPTDGPLFSSTGAPSAAARPGHPVADLAADGGLGRVAGPATGAAAAESPFGAWVSTLARSKQRAPTTARPSAGDGTREAPSRDGTAARPTAATRSDRLAAADVAASVPVAATTGAAAGLLDAGAPGERRDAARGTEAPTHSGHAAADAGGSASGGPLPDPAEFGLQLGQALGDAFETIGAQVSLWAAGKTQRASFSVEEGLDDPLAVDVTVTDGVAQLSFRTDDGAMRQLIQAQAPAALADALARAGLTLGGLDVGGQSGRGRQDASDGPRPRTTRVGLTGIAPAGDVGPGARTGPGRRDTGRAGLDVYA